MKTTLKKCLAWVLTLCMTLALLPVTALAADTYEGITVSEGTSDVDYSWNGTTKTLTILKSTPLTLSGTATGVQVLVAGTTEANLTLNGLNIDNTGEHNDAPIKLTDTAKLNLTLANTSVNTLDTHYTNISDGKDILYARADAIHVPQGTALTISGAGTLNAKSGRGKAAIGNNLGATGDIIINSGTVNALAYGTENYPGGVGIGGITNTDSTSGGGKITINGGTVTAYGDMAGIGYYDSTYNSYTKSGVKSNFTISITGGTVKSYGIPYSDGVKPDDASSTYLRSVGIGGHAVGVPGARNIEISGGTVTAYGSNAGIGGNFDEDNSGDSTDILNIKLTGGQIIAKSFDTFNAIGIGGYMRSTDHRAIEISGTASVDAVGRDYKKSAIGGGDNSGSTITIKGNAVVKSASSIGSSGYDYTAYNGFAGGTIQILENASVGSDHSEGANHIGGSDANSGTGGAGGDVTINTTGMVKVTSIGGGDGKNDGNGGDGGSITIQNGNLLVAHIGGGDGVGGTGGNGGTIHISGGTMADYPFPRGSTQKGSTLSSAYASAGIGGGGGTTKGGNGGTITISGGTVNAASSLTVYDTSSGEMATAAGASGTGIGGAGIGGGNGADGGVINITGGTVKVEEVSTYPDKPASATALPALIGGGSAGGAGEITISGGSVWAYVMPENVPAYGSDATTIGQGKGATNAGGFVKITGGDVLAYTQGPNASTYAKPTPWPTAANGSTKLYPATFSFYNATGMPDNLDFYSNSQIVSMSIKEKSSGNSYSYGIKDMTPTSRFWLPVEGDIAMWGDESHELYTVALSVKKDNTVYSFDGTISYFKNPNFVGGITSSSSLTYKGQVIESLQLSSDWGNDVKTYNGTDLKPSFTVKNMKGETLTENTDYTLTITYKPNGSQTQATETITEMINSGSYKITATGMSGTAYAGMTAAIDELWINPKRITAVYSGGTFTKAYDGTTDVYSGGLKLESLPLTISGGVAAGDELTNIVAQNPRYRTSGVGTGIAIDANSPSYTYKHNGSASSIYNYNIELPSNITGDITVKVIGESSLDASGVTVSKVYDGTTNCTMTNVTGSVALKNLVGQDIAMVTVSGVSMFDSKDAGNTHKVTLSLGDLSGANAANYALAGGAKTIEINNAKILAADYAYNLTPAQQTQEFTQGGAASQIVLPDSAVGVNSETVKGLVSLWHDAACMATPATDVSLAALKIGQHNLYVKFVPDASETNYTAKVTTGKVVVLSVVEGEPQNLSFASSDAVSKTYGDQGFTNAATNNSAGGGTISYTSSNSDVAVVDAVTGNVTVKRAGVTTITATAAKVEGKYRETSATYILTVAKKAIIVTADNATRKFGQANPAFAMTIPNDALVGDDKQNDLGVSLLTSATASSNVGNYSILGISSSANYAVTVTPGTLTVEKADSPNVANISKSLLYSEAHNDVAVIITGLPSDRGATSFGDYSVNGDTEIIKSGVATTTDGLRFSTNPGNENESATISVKAIMQNYADTTVNITVKLVNKIPVTIGSVSVSNKTYDGTAIAYTGTPTNENGYSGIYDYIWSSGTAPKDVGNYTLTVKIPEDNANYMGDLVLSFTISPKALTAKPKDISIYNGASLPESFELEFVGMVSGDTVTVNGTPSYQLQMKDGAVLSDSKTNGSYVIRWTNADKITLDNANYTFAKADGTLTISAKSSGGSSGGGTTIVTPTTPNVSSGNGTSTAKVDATVKTSGNAVKASVSADSLSAAIKAAVKIADEKKTNAAVEIKADAPTGATEIEFSIPKTALKTFSDSGAKTLSLVSGVGEMAISADAAASIATQTGSSDVAVSIEKLNTGKSLSQKQQAAVGDAPVYDISITSGDKRISTFGGNTLTVTLPYTLKTGEDSSGVVVWYVDDLGNIQKVSSVYDASRKVVVFTTNHLSLYAVGYEKTASWRNPFADVSGDAWYYSAIQYVAQKDMMSGTAANAFSPNLTTTRGMLATILYRLESSPSVDGADFTDVLSGEWYANAVSWASKNGIAGGYGNGKFGPSNPITREQLAVMLMNYAKQKGYDTTVSDGSLASFKDASKISPWAVDAMKWAVSKGLITGKSDSVLDSSGSATRSQVAVILMRFCELIKK